MYATDRYLYTLLHAIGDAMNLQLLLLNWNGKPLKKIITDKRLLRLCMDETQNTIYAIVVDEENGYELISISVPEIE